MRNIAVLSADRPFRLAPSNGRCDELDVSPGV